MYTCIEDSQKTSTNSKKMKIGTSINLVKIKNNSKIDSTYDVGSVQTVAIYKAFGWQVFRFLIVL